MRRRTQVRATKYWWTQDMSAYIAETRDKKLACNLLDHQLTAGGGCEKEKDGKRETIRSNERGMMDARCHRVEVRDVSE